MGTAVEAQALDLLDRLEDCGLAGGLTEEDFSPGAPVREPVRTACSELARRVWALHESLPVASHAKLQQAVLRTLAAAESEATARAGQLDASLEALASALDAAFRLPEGEGLLRRLRALEAVVAAVQAGALVRARGAQDSATDAQADEISLAGEHVAASGSLRALAGVLDADAGAVSAVPLAAECRAAVEAAVRRLPDGFFAPILGAEDATLRESLAEVDAALRAEYRLRRRMLLERARVTVRSLLWSDKLEEPERAALEARASEALAAAGGARDRGAGRAPGCAPGRRPRHDERGHLDLCRRHALHGHQARRHRRGAGPGRARGGPRGAHAGLGSAPGARRQGGWRATAPPPKTLEKGALML
ncbi:hypothetical protein QBZ16_003592 [Prototheca wickerhamii]|uniref:Uncharacterized protein n=1 Tax=Prototheca wickerhamii TaxID=3111 RepID=A0AAD9MIP4_PROWI|nr:hypothetical protein QBZ16_003592 [Prototheca wickerhamii]